MDKQPDKDVPEPEASDVQDLGRSYGALLQQGDWQVDVDDNPGTPAPPDGPTEASKAPPPPLRVVEALLFIGGAPLTAARAGEVVRGLSAEQFQQAIDTR